MPLPQPRETCDKRRKSEDEILNAGIKYEGSTLNCQKKHPVEKYRQGVF